MELAAHLPGLHLCLQRLVSSRCKPQAPAPGKKKNKKNKNPEVKLMIASRGQGRPSVTIGAKCPVLSLPPAPLVIIPVPAFPPPLSSPRHRSASHSISLSPSLDWHFLSCLYLTPLIPLSLAVSSAAQNPLWCTKTHLTGSRYRHQSQYHSEDVRRALYPETICIAPALRRATNREGGKWSGDSFLTWFGMLTHRTLCSLTGRISSTECKYSFSWTWILNGA